MMRTIVVWCWLGVIAAGMSALRAESPWLGLWQIVGEGAQSSAAFLVVSAEGSRLKPVLYNRTWAIQRLESWNFSEDTLLLDVEAGARSFRYQLTLSDEGFNGFWMLRHPQFRERREVTGHRIFQVNHWDPHEGLRQLADPSRFVDLSGYLSRNAPLESFEDFQGYWDREIKVRFFRIFYPVLYQGEISEKVRQNRLRQIWNSLKSKEFQTFSKQLAEHRADVVAALKEKQPELYFANHFISMPTAGVIETTLEQIDDSVFVVFATEHLMKAVPLDQLRPWLVRWQLRLPLFASVPADSGNALAQVVSEGVAAAWAVKLGFAQNPAQAFGVSTLGDIAGAKAKLARGLPNLEVKGIPDADLMALAAEFGSRIVESFSVHEILSFPQEKWIEFYVDYLTE